jgi:hypothetical protein
MRTPIPNEIAADVMFRHDRTCCICNAPGKSVQIHHIDENPVNHDPENLAVLCLEHHEETQIRGGFGRKLRDVDVRKHKEDWLKRVADRRSAADKIIIERMTMLTSEADAPYWVRPSDEALTTFLNTLPIIYQDIRRRAAPLKASVVRGDMLHGLQMVIDVLTQSWIRLAAWYPPKHFGGVRADEYIAKFVADRYSWNLALAEPEGPGSGGREAAIFAHADTQYDIELTIVDTVRRLGMGLLEFDFATWREKWELAKANRQTDDENENSSGSALARNSDVEIICSTEKAFNRVVVNEYGVHRTIYLGIKNSGCNRVSNCIFHRTYISSLNDKQKVFLDGPFSLEAGEIRYIPIATFNETRDLPHSNHMIGLSIQGSFGAGVMVPRLLPDRRHVVSFLVESPEASDVVAHCEIWIDENGKLCNAKV